MSHGYKRNQVLSFDDLYLEEMTIYDCYGEIDYSLLDLEHKYKDIIEEKNLEGVKIETGYKSPKE